MKKRIDKQVFCLISVSLFVFNAVMAEINENKSDENIVSNTTIIDQIDQKQESYNDLINIYACNWFAQSFC